MPKYVSDLSYLEPFTKIGAACVVAIRLFIFGIHLFRTLHDRKRFRVAGYVDPRGVVEIHIRNQTTKAQRVQKLYVVIDASMWRLLLRRLVGVDSLFRFRNLEWTKLFDLPTKCRKNRELVLHGYIDAAEHDISALRSARLKKPMVRIVIAGRSVLVPLSSVDGVLELPENG